MVEPAWVTRRLLKDRPEHLGEVVVTQVELQAGRLQPGRS